MDQERAVIEATLWLEYIKKEGWETVAYRLYRMPKEHGEDYLLNLTFWDADGGNEGGHVILVPKDQIDEIRVMVFDLELTESKPIEEN